MEISIGIQFAPRELTIETKASVEDVQRQIDEAFADGRKLLWFTDERGKQVAIPVDKVAYVEVGSDRDTKPVGFAREVG
jgi:hypothetical protein